MIDTDKYEGHTEDGETWGKYANCASWRQESPHTWCRSHAWATKYLGDADAQLIADAPLLLAEVKRLQKEVRKQSNIIGVINDLVYDDGSYNLTWNEFNEIMEMKE
tara:strand:- start:67 stop:384 length:318 start_codon:yes stop_codon:yes gene_type:complete